MRLLRLLVRPFVWLIARESGLAELASGLAILAWGLLAFQQFQPADEPASVATLRELGLLRASAFVAIILGLGQTFALDLIDKRWERPWARCAGGCAGLLFWGELSGGVLYQGTPIPPGDAAVFAMLIINVVLIPRTIRRRS